MSSCSNDDQDEGVLYDAPYVRSYTTYTSQNSVRLNGFIDQSNIVFREVDTYKVGFILRAGDQNDSTNDQIIELTDNVEYYTGTYNFSHNIDSLEPNTTYYYTAYTKNGASKEYNWNSFTTSAIACTYSQDNYYSIAGIWNSANVEINDPNCCDEGNIEFQFGGWPNIIRVHFNELNNGYPKTGQYFGVEGGFDISNIEKELVKSSNQVWIEYYSTSETELFVDNDGVTITLIFCNTTFNNGDILNGKVSVDIP